MGKMFNVLWSWRGYWVALRWREVPMVAAQAQIRALRHAPVVLLGAMAWHRARNPAQALAVLQER